MGAAAAEEDSEEEEAEEMELRNCNNNDPLVPSVSRSRSAETMAKWTAIKRDAWTTPQSANEEQNLILSAILDAVVVVACQSSFSVGVH